MFNHIDIMPTYKHNVSNDVELRNKPEFPKIGL